jgi:hypothetical protein
MMFKSAAYGPKSDRKKRHSGRGAVREDSIQRRAAQFEARHLKVGLQALLRVLTELE